MSIWSEGDKASIVGPYDAFLYPDRETAVSDLTEAFRDLFGISTKVGFNEMGYLYWFDGEKQVQNLETIRIETYKWSAILYIQLLGRCVEETSYNPSSLNPRNLRISRYLQEKKGRGI